MNVTCVILNYNDSETTISLIEKIQQYSIINHLVIIDNCSIDNSFKELSEYASDNIHVLQTPKNGGYGYGNNYGILYSYHELKSEYTIIANPDVEFSEHTIESLLEIIDQNEDCGIVSCKPINRDKKLDYARKNTSGLHDVLSASLIINKLFGARYYDDQYFQGETFCEVYEVPGSFLIVKTPVMVEYGMYDEEIFLFEEEKVLAYKMAQNNFKTLLSLSHEYIHNHNVSISKTYKSNIEKKKLLLNSKYTFLKKYRDFNNIQLFLAKVFFKFTLFEMYVYSIYLNFKK